MWRRWIVTSAYGQCDVLSLLIKAGADVNQVDDNGETPLMRTQDLACVRLLLDGGACLALTDMDGWNALHYASSGEMWRSY